MSRRKLAIAAALLFAVIWVLGMTSSFAAGHCLGEQRDAKSRVFSCTLASATTFSRFSLADRAEFVRIEFERGVVLAETQRTDEARAAMRSAIGHAGLDIGWLKAESLAPANLAEAVILERLQRLDTGSVAFEIFARLQDDV